MVTGTELDHRSTTVNIGDETGSVDLLHIEGKTLEEYFGTAGKQLPQSGFTAVMDGARLGANDVLPAGATVTVGRLVRNG